MRVKEERERWRYWSVSGSPGAQKDIQLVRCQVTIKREKYARLQEEKETVIKRGIIETQEQGQPLFITSVYSLVPDDEGFKLH